MTAPENCPVCGHAWAIHTLDGYCRFDFDPLRPPTDNQCKCKQPARGRTV